MHAIDALKSNNYHPLLQHFLLCVGFINSSAYWWIVFLSNRKIDRQTELYSEVWIAWSMDTSKYIIKEKVKHCLILGRTEPVNLSFNMFPQCMLPDVAP